MSTTSLDSFLKQLAESLQDQSFVRLVLSDPASDEGKAGRVVGRWVHAKGTDVLSLTFRYERRDETQNSPLADASQVVGKLLASDYRKALLGTTRSDWQLILDPSHPEGGRLIRHPASQKSAPPRGHDHEKPTTLDSRAHDWMRELHLITPEGKPRASMSDKLRQIHRYLELLHHHLQPSTLPPDRPIRIADLGCGKAYLTFAVWHWLSRMEQRTVEVVGVEARPDLVRECTRIATSLPAPGLEFKVGQIATTTLGPLDLLVALHACNRATDEAILKGVESGARWMVLAPCCHQDLRPQLAEPAPFDLLLQHGLFKERFAEWLTDGLRALYLEAAGYQTKAIEFVSPEHTTKNLMLLATRRHPSDTLPSSTASSGQPAVRERIRSLERLFGIENHPLTPLLG